MNTTLLIKLGRIAVHADNVLFSGQGHPFDMIAISLLLGDKEVKKALADLKKEGLLPVRRGGVKHK